MGIAERPQATHRLVVQKNAPEVFVRYGQREIVRSCSSQVEL
jgi:hypothetical protein